jgi:broad specificity phosphatase PhoE
LRSDFPKVDFGGVDIIWPDKTSPEARLYAYTRTDILARGQRALSHLRDRPEDLIFVVTHSGFLRQGCVGRWFFNSDYRIFDFKGQAGDAGIQLEEDPGTDAGGLGLSRTEPVALGTGLPG